MTTAQPGQEQRMETPRDRIVGWLAHLERHGYGDDLMVNETLGVTAGDLRALVELTRPTADLGEDGELVERLRRYVSIADGKALASVPPSALRQAADRLILYREALERIAAFEAKGAGANYYFEQVWELVDVARAVLSRSGG